MTTYNTTTPITIHPGDDYKTTDNRSLRFIAHPNDNTWPSISAATITLTVEERDGTDIFTATGTGYDSDPAEALVPLTAAQTTLLAASTIYEYRLKATLTSGNIVTLATGTIHTT